MPRMEKGERAFVRWIQRQFPVNPLRAPIPIGDDMAALRVDAGTIFVSSDMLLDGIHFRTSEHAPERIGRKALGASLSDCAAMAVRPVAALTSIALPRAWTLEQAEGLYLGMKPLADEFNVALVGGDTTSWSGPLVVDVCVLAQRWAGVAPVTRGGARPGDLLFASGRLGGSLRGRHLDFTPRVALARRLAEQCGARLHAMMDVTDGLLIDLHRLCEASGVGAELEAAALLAQSDPAAEACAREDGRSVLDHVLTDGEDFELLCAIGPGDEPAFTAAGEEWPGRPIGRVIDSGLFVIHPGGRREAAAPRGWEHPIGGAPS